jgi:uncharacterized membrane protein
VPLSDRHSPAGNWLYPLISGLALFILAAAAVYVLTSLWRERTADVGAAEPAPAPASPSSLSAVEILDRRLASGEITIEQYEQLDALLARRHTAADATATVAASNGGATAAV